jgi:hypothetical protein
MQPPLGHKKFNFVLEMRIVTSAPNNQNSDSQTVHSLQWRSLSYRVTSIQPGTQYHLSIRIEGPTLRATLAHYCLVRLMG